MKERVALWDNVKFFLIVAVVLGHGVGEVGVEHASCRGIFMLLYPFHMPLFLFVSGLFYKAGKTAQDVLFYTSCGFALKIALSVTYMVNGAEPSFSLLSDGDIPWFMFVLAMYQIVMHYLNKTLPNKTSYVYLLVANIILACFLGYDKTIGDFLYLSRAIVFFPFFLSGTLINEETIRSFRKKYAKVLIPLSAVIVLLWAYLCFFHVDVIYVYRHLFTGRNPFSSAVVGYGFSARMFCYTVSVLLSASVICLCPNKSIPLVTKFGSRTLNVYFWHYIVQYTLTAQSSITALYEMGISGKLAYILVCVILAFCLSAKIFELPMSLFRKMCYAPKDTSRSKDSVSC